MSGTAVESKFNALIVGAVKDSFLAERKEPWPVQSNRASIIGHDCERFLVYNRTRWREAKQPDADLLMIFEDGHTHEKAMFERIKKAGFVIHNEARSFTWGQYQIGGKIEGDIIIGTQGIPFDFKTMSPFQFDMINTVEDMLKSKYVYMRSYPVQLMAYELMHNKDFGLFICKNKANGQWKVIECPLDYELMEGVLKKIERVNEHLSAKTLPDKINRADICEDCSYRHICLPDIIQEGPVEFLPEKAEADLDRIEALKKTIEPLKDAEKEIKTLTDGLKEMTKGQPICLAGKYKILGKEISRDGFTVQPTKYWQMKYDRIELPAAEKKD